MGLQSVLILYYYAVRSNIVSTDNIWGMESLDLKNNGINLKLVKCSLIKHKNLCLDFLT